MENEELQGAQVAFSLAARLVSCEPDEAWLARCIEERPFTAAPFGEEDAAVSRGLCALDEWCVESAENASDAACAVQREWLRLLAGCGEPEAPIVESYYTDPSKKLFSQATVDVRRRYRAWGLEFVRRESEPDDSLGLMLAFCAHLIAEELKAKGSGDASRAREAQRSLLADHLLPWASAWRFLMGSHAKTKYYQGVGELVFGLQRAYAARFDIAFNAESGSFSFGGLKA